MFVRARVRICACARALCVCVRACVRAGVCLRACVRVILYVRVLHACVHVWEVDTFESLLSSCIDNVAHSTHGFCAETSGGYTGRTAE